MKGGWILIIIVVAWQFLPAQNDISPASKKSFFIEKKEQRSISVSGCRNLILLKPISVSMDMLLTHWVKDTYR
jgi:hypothetical protein